MLADIQEEMVMLKARLEEEATIASGYGQGAYALFRGAMHEFSQKGMRIRVLVITCAFTLQNLSGAAGKKSSSIPCTETMRADNDDSYQLLLAYAFRISRCY
jgi:hypothetical protein